MLSQRSVKQVSSLLLAGLCLTLTPLASSASSAGSLPMPQSRLVASALRPQPVADADVNQLFGNANPAPAGLPAVAGQSLPTVVDQFVPAAGRPRPDFAKQSGLV
ncbi:MAG: hypothetical protein LBG70_00260, partial [Bifidobacteriaceae bacterium]|nr:hypothetical protein [Bifidobacteriaceae bacterium]